MNTILIYEDNKCDNFAPLSHFHPVYELKCGIKSLRAKFESLLSGNSFQYSMRDYLKDSFVNKYPATRVNEPVKDDCLFLNGRVLATPDFVKSLKGEDEEVFYFEDEVVAFRLKKDNPLIDKIISSSFDQKLLRDLPGSQVEVNILSYSWDLIANLSSELESDFDRYFSPSQAVEFENVSLINPENMSIDKNVKIMPNVVLDASKGPIVIEENVQIMPFSYIQGPAYIGAHSIIKAHTSLYHNCSIGEYCKVGGEIEDTIIHGYSNKQHEGFLGHSYLGEWINIGADTNNSDLKNNYGSISVYVNDRLIDTGMQFLGLIMGDHSKTAINTMFNTGTIVGVSCNIFGSGFPKRKLPSFTFGGADIMRVNSLEKSIEVAKLVMKRRNVSFTDADEKLFRDVFAMTSEERN